MTVSELIAALSVFPADMRVVIPGYERDADDADLVAIVRAALDSNADLREPAKKESWWAGRHEIKDSASLGEFESATEVVMIGAARGA